MRVTMSGVSPFYCASNTIPSKSHRNQVIREGQKENEQKRFEIPPPPFYMIPNSYRPYLSCLGRKPTPHHLVFSIKELHTTLTELNAIAKAAHTGFNLMCRLPTG